jgi:hypothetical protein
MINLGDKVKDSITGFEGIVTGKTIWLNGCTRVGVQSDVLKDGVPTEAQWIDEPQLKVIESQKVSMGPRDTGGPIPTPKRANDPVR